MSNKKNALPRAGGGLTYIGAGAALENVPARDLAEADINTLADRWAQDPGATRDALLASGLYDVAPASDAPESEA
jgi:hypothetical protein